MIRFCRPGFFAAWVFLRKLLGGNFKKTTFHTIIITIGFLGSLINTPNQGRSESVKIVHETYETWNTKTDHPRKSSSCRIFVGTLCYPYRNHGTTSTSTYILVVVFFIQNRIPWNLWPSSWSFLSVSNPLVIKSAKRHIKVDQGQVWKLWRLACKMRIPYPDQQWCE